ncbi:MAG: ATP-binding cassette domain-containing protein [Candidatus Kapaibacteriales bacterium]
MAFLEVDDVVKYFGKYKATNNVSFNVEEGKIYGLLGPNGAGKTTLIRMITNIYQPDDGEIRFKGEVVNPKLQSQMGYLPEERGLYKKIKAIDQLVYFGTLKGLSSAEAKRRAMLWLTKLNANDFADKKIQELSKGMAQKIQFIATILHDPPFLILDEPFSGFDPVNAELLKNTVLELNRQGTTIILSTHVMQQVEEMCDSITLINKGTAVLQGNVREIKKRHGRNILILETRGDNSFLNDIESIEIINLTPNRAEIRILNGEQSAKEVLNKAIECCEINRYELLEPHLNQIFIETVSGIDNQNVTTKEVQ